MNDTRDATVSSDEHTHRKVWLEPALTEFDVDDVTQSQIFIVADGIDFS